MGLFDKKKTDVEVAEQAIELALPSSKDVAIPVDKETVIKYMAGTGLTSKLTPDETGMFIDMAMLHQLNPFKREIYCIPYSDIGSKWRSVSIVTGYEVYLSKAQKSGLLESWRVEECAPETPIGSYWCTVFIKRRDQQKEQSWRVYYAEAFQTTRDGTPNKFWKKQPRFMTRKVCMGQAFRLFFEDILHGSLYTKEEDFGEMDENPLPPSPRPVEKVLPKPKADVIEDGDPKMAEPVAKVAEPVAAPTKSTFAQIMEHINGGKIPNEAKPNLMAQARGHKVGENEEGLKALLSKIEKGEYK